MSRSSWVNAAGLVFVLGLAAILARATPRAPVVAPAPPAQIDSADRRVPLPGGGFGLPDSTGYVVPLRNYKRIVSASMTTDRLLVELCEPDRVLAFSDAGVRESPWAYQYAGKANVNGLGSLEALISLKPDLVLMNTYGASGHVPKLRAAGIEAFDLGELRGLSSFVRVAEAVGALVGHPERAADLVTGFRRRLAGVAWPLGNQRRRTAVYLMIIGPNLYGGTVGTGYHDVLTAAGLVDVAAGRFRDWPSYSSEQLIALGPELIVTKIGGGAVVCTYPGLDRLPACQRPGLILELPAGLLDDPGLGMLDAAERLFALAYPAAAHLDTMAPRP